MNYKVKVKKISIVNEGGDRVVVITCYLIDSYGTAIQAVDGTITFDVRVPKSTSIPDPVPTTYLPDLAKAQIIKKYNRYLTVTNTPTHGTNKLIFNSSDVGKLFIDLLVIGPGITTTTKIQSITATTEIQLNQNLTLQITGTTTSPNLSINGDTTIDSNIITNLTTTTGIVTGMTISGTGIAYGSTVLAINSSTAIKISQNATSSNAGVTFTFSTVTDSIYLNSSTAYFTSTIYEGLSISGPSTVPRNTTIDEIISTTKVKMTNNATGAGSGTTTISGSFTYYFDASNLTLDTDELTNISENLINFANL